MVGFLDTKFEGSKLSSDLDKGNLIDGAGFLGSSSGDNDRSKYSLHVGKEVKVSTDNKTELGVFHSYDDLFIYLIPSVVNEPIYNEDGKIINKCRIENDRPSNIRRFSCDITPVKEGYMEEYVNSVNKIKVEKSK